MKRSCRRQAAEIGCGGLVRRKMTEKKVRAARHDVPVESPQTCGETVPKPVSVRPAVAVVVEILQGFARRHLSNEAH